jgi:Calcineurin-like phosphoesterase
MDGERPPLEDRSGPAEPTASEAARPSVEPRSPARIAGLFAVAFFGTLVVLAGVVLGFRGIAASSGGVASTPTPVAVASGSLLPGATPTPLPGGSGGAAGSAGPPLASGSPSGDPVLVGAGDIASCNLEGDEATAKLLDGIAGTVFTAGDSAYENGSDADFENCYAPTWGRHLGRTRPAAGNHDYGTANAQGYRDYFGTAALNDQGETWYSYDLEAWHVIVLDANCSAVGGCGPDSPQGQWLAADLAASPTRCTMAIWHQPRFSSGDEHGDDPSVDPFWRALYDAGADVVVNGHDHDYERFAPQDPDAREDRERGIREFVVGTGGAALRGFDDPKPNSELRLAVSPGVIAFTLHPSGYDWRWIPTESSVTDSGSASCH